MRDCSNWVTRTHHALTRAALSLGFRIFEITTKKIFAQILYWNTRWIPKKGKILFVKTSVIILIWYWCNVAWVGFSKKKSSKCIWILNLDPSSQNWTKILSIDFSFSLKSSSTVIWSDLLRTRTNWKYLLRLPHL